MIPFILAESTQNQVWHDHCIDCFDPHKAEQVREFSAILRPHRNRRGFRWTG